ncbi:MAG: sensor domain-containing diguanylate cyclase [Candidatus Omnitrophica bacterium]|nr:sensor domain-containing diguanylate cyclase [Candidatus Omnitrophota bacterium]
MGSKPSTQFSFGLSLAFCAAIAFYSILCLGYLKNTVNPEIYLNQIALCLFLLFLPILGGWYTFHIIGGLCFGLFSLTLVIFIVSVSSTQLYLWFIPEYLLLLLILHKLDQSYSVKMSLISTDREKFQIEKNDQMVSYKSKGEAISILFEKYSTYYNMRKLAEELATTFAILGIAEIVVNRCMDFVLRGDVALISVFEHDTSKLPVIAYREIDSGKKNKPKVKPQHYEPDLFDYWVVKNRRQLIVIDCQQDFRFNTHDTQKLPHIRSLIIAPLVQAGRVIGTLRIHSSKPNTFTHDDLRLLDTIAILAASALSNAILYAQTQELAIKDSLTGLYVRRYFFERLKEDHRRYLITQRPMSLLMCDLDYFKQCNDRHGHAVGDMMLVQFAKLLTQISEGAIVGRYGGEEFVVLLPETNKKDAVKLAEEFRQKVELAPLVIRREEIRMTVSIGVASIPEDTLSIETLLEKSDKALYEAKRKGRNQVC